MTTQHWLRQWLGPKHAKSRYLNQNQGPVYIHIYASLGLDALIFGKGVHNQKGHVGICTLICSYRQSMMPCILICECALIHWGRVTRICIGNQTIIGSDNGLLPSRLQTIIRTNARRVNWILGHKIQWNLNRNSYIFLQECVGWPARYVYGLRQIGFYCETMGAKDE